MSGSIRATDYVEHFNPDLPHHRAWLLAVLEQLVAHELDNRPDKTEFEFSKAIKLYNFIIHSPSLVLRLWQLRFRFAQ